ncbi:MAG: hypothetical protein ACLFTR_05100 [Candidatus Woesearchaeota archaeon]
MDLKSFYKEHPYIFHYLISIPLLIILVIGINIITRTPVERVPEVIAASFLFPIPILIGLVAARIGTKKIEGDKNAEVAFVTIWLLVTNAFPILNLMGGQDMTTTVLAALPITAVLLLNYSLKRILA